MRIIKNLALSLLFILTACSPVQPTADVYNPDISGTNLALQVCSACHEKGVVNAPKLGDQTAWGKLISEGQVIITAHGYVGVRAMPPRGGKEDLSVEQFSKALNYMVNKSGGNWISPSKSMLEEINKEISIRTMGKLSK